MTDLDPEEAARASEALVDGLREADELAHSAEVGKPLADMLWFCNDMLDVLADYVERPDTGEGERGAFMEIRERVAELRAQLSGSSSEPGRA
jgi:hypothetical protein